jgi:hypothetical protein
LELPSRIKALNSGFLPFIKRDFESYKPNLTKKIICTGLEFFSWKTRKAFAGHGMCENENVFEDRKKEFIAQHD